MATNKTNAKSRNYRVSKICMLISGICMGNIGIIITILESSGHSFYSIILFRGIFGTMFLSIFMLKTGSFSKAFIKESLTFHWKPLLLLGIFNSAMNILYFISISISGYAVSAFLLYTSGIYVLFFLVLTKQEKVSKINLFCFILAIIGVAIIMEFWSGDFFPIGILIGLFSGLAYGTSVFLLKIIYIQRDKNFNNFKAKGDFDTFLAWWSTLFFMFLFLPFGASGIFHLTIIDVFYCLLLGLIPTALPFFLYNYAVKNDKGGNIIILSYFEPIMATINAAIFSQKLSLYTILGGTLILIANIIVLKISTINNRN